MINNGITLEQIKKIFANKEQKLEYLRELYKLTKIASPIPKTQSGINNAIISTWEFKISNKIIRKLFEKTEKYRVGKYSANDIKEMMEQWNKLQLGKLDWPFQPIAFDQHVQDINTKKSLTEAEKDDILKKEIVMFRRIKKINTARNDFIEFLIVTNNENVTPTLKHSRGVDFYINGCPFDQKVSRSVTKEFINDYGDNWREAAKKHPEIVAKYLYKYQDAARFGAEPRLLVVSLDEDITEDEIYNCVINTDFTKPVHISFDYKHSDDKIVKYDVDCYIILLGR